MNSEDIARRIAEAIGAADPTIDDPRAVSARFDRFLASLPAEVAGPEGAASPETAAPPRPAAPVESAAVGPAAAVESAAVGPAAVEPAAVEPAAVGSAAVGSAVPPDAQRRLRRAVADLDTPGSLPATARRVADGVVTGLGYEFACVHLVRVDGTLVLAALSGDPVAESPVAGRVDSRASWERRLSLGERWGDLVFLPHTEGRGPGGDDVPPGGTEGFAPRSEELRSEELRSGELPSEGGWHPADRLFAPMYAPDAEGGERGELLGVLSVVLPGHGQPPDAGEREALRTYARQAAVALSDARLRAARQRAAVRAERGRRAARPGGEETGQRERGRAAPAYRGNHDSLTGLLNAVALRRWLGARLCHHLQSGDHEHTVAPEGDGDVRGLAVLFYALHGFTTINDRFGHRAGDTVLVQVARRLTDSVGDEDIVARFGAAEFVVLADGVNDAEARDLSVRLANALVHPIRAEGRMLRVGARFGIGWAHCGRTADDVLRCAAERTPPAAAARSTGSRHVGSGRGTGR